MDKWLEWLSDRFADVSLGAVAMAAAIGIGMLIPQVVDLIPGPIDDFLEGVVVLMCFGWVLRFLAALLHNK